MNEFSKSSSESLLDTTEDENLATAHRMFLFEEGWSIRIKSGSHREFCHMMAPGQDFYHRLLDREIFLVRSDERLCLACATRRGLIALQPKRLRDSITSVPADLEAIPLELDSSDTDRADTSPVPRRFGRG
jgi:hypothetical protein